MIERIQSFSRKVEVYLIAFVLTLGLLMMANLQSAKANSVFPTDLLGNTLSWHQTNN